MNFTDTTRDAAATAARHTPEQVAFLALQRLAGDLAAGVAELLRTAELSGAQYNVLRILRGAAAHGAGAGLACGQIAERLVTRDPDITRLLDRLEKRGLVTRVRESADRRVVTTRITDEGLELLARLDEPMLELHRRQLGHLGGERLAQLIALLEEAAGG